MKKIVIVLAVLFLMSAVPAGAAYNSGIGFYGNLAGNGTGAGGGAGLTLRYGQFPVLGIEWNFMPKASLIGVSLDAWLVNHFIAERLAYYIGIGGYAAITGGAPNTFHFGGRVPVGLQLFPIDPLEIFLEVSPMIILVPAIDWTLSARLGFRILY
ncbi:MAG: hypothetical protein CVV21_04935 [Candidatus Goldiibacteriota bacterium HGW-Goldbacteria-1]|jgi:hypothetical protein|nr:MAG: hypothetical protein CVV21_04935 [Candidatus Goldiibacteriota bacterium HGW-Goldbacteria-1]